MSRDTYVGIDQSVGGFGLCMLVPSSDHYKVWVEKFPLDKYEGREVWQLHAVEDFLIEALKGWHDRIKLVAREGAAYAALNGREKAGAVAYAVDSTLYEWLPEPHGYPVVIPPTKVKLFATGNGGASKDEVCAGVEKNWGVTFSNHNIADAYVLARMAYAIDTGIVVTDYQAEVIDDILNPKPKSKKSAKKKAA